MFRFVGENFFLKTDDLNLVCVHWQKNNCVFHLACLFRLKWQFSLSLHIVPSYSHIYIEFTLTLFQQ